MLYIPLVLQALAMIVDEGVFHRRRDLPRWERIGHPLDTLTIAICLALLVAVPPSHGALHVYIALAAFSSLFVTKDEAVHARACGAGEMWLHALLFVLHPIVLAALGILWWNGGHHALLAGQLAVVCAFGAYQAIYWNVVRRPRTIDNQWYAPLGARWYEADDTPIALLRAEARHRNPWIADVLGATPKRVLDLGCGGGLLSNDLAARGHDVIGLDPLDDNLAVARAYDRTGRASYVRGDARALPFADASLDAVCAMDLLEHVEEPERVVAEAARVLAPGGVFFFHTFNRTWLAKLIVIDGVALFVRDAPKDLHVLHMFVRPDELSTMCEKHSLKLADIRGSRPRFRWPLWRMLATGRVGDDFAFTFTRSLKLGYTGYAIKSSRDTMHG